MKNILFLEDRPARQSVFLPNKLSDIETLNQIIGLVMPIGQVCNDIISKINDSSFELDEEVKLIIIHKSALSTQGFSFLTQKCKTNSVDLICFSGGISQMIYSNEDFQFLNINSADLYTKNLIPFIVSYINEEKPNLLELINSNWRISYWLLLRQLIKTKEIEIRDTGEDLDSDRLNYLDLKIENISKLLDFDSSKEDINKSIEKTLIQI